MSASDSAPVRDAPLHMPGTTAPTIGDSAGPDTTAVLCRIRSLERKIYALRPRVQARRAAAAGEPVKEPEQPIRATPPAADNAPSSAPAPPPPPVICVHKIVHLRHLPLNPNTHLRPPGMLLKPHYETEMLGVGVMGRVPEPCPLLIERIRKYVPMMLETRAARVDLEASFPASVIESWTTMAAAWEEDAKKKNPFESTNWGMDDVQRLFIPEITLLREREDKERKRIAPTQPPPGLRAQDMKLWLPSAIGTRADCDEALQDYEYQLRKGQAVAALSEMRNKLLLRTHKYQYRDSVHGVRAKTRSRTRTKGIQARIDIAAGEHRAARAALVSLGAVLGRTEWQQHCKLLKTRMCGPGPARYLVTMRGSPLVIPRQPGDVSSIQWPVTTK
ncbi:hypothetical protein B0H14DRAFT_3691553 [Mycena olivaceomarginata]|nr:hypothetical protein B0H14DRAFT_3691553 [Mycena olivaceomarginata]